MTWPYILRPASSGGLGVQGRCEVGELIEGVGFRVGGTRAFGFVSG